MPRAKSEFVGTIEEFAECVINSALDSPENRGGLNYVDILVKTFMPKNGDRRKLTVSASYVHKQQDGEGRRYPRKIKAYEYSTCGEEGELISSCLEELNREIQTRHLALDIQISESKMIVRRKV